MSVKNIVEMVNVSGELGTNEDKWMIEKIRSCPHTVTAKGKRYMGGFCYDRGPPCSIFSFLSCRLYQA